MRLRNTTEAYGSVAKTLHWLVVFLVIVSWATGLFGEEWPIPESVNLFSHITSGLAIIAVVDMRLLWRIGDPPPPPERTALGQWADRGSRLMHYVLYALVLGVPVIGILLQFSQGDALPIIGLFEIPSPWVEDRAFAHDVKEVHEILANVLVILAGIHAAAALFHHWILRDRTLIRILPWG
jgi:cytochrome b561